MWEMNSPTSKAFKELSPQHRAAVEKLRKRFEQLPDPRMKGRVLHRIDEVVMVGLCSILSDNDAFTDMEAFASSQLDWLRTFLPLTNGAPSHDVFRNVFMAIQPGALVAILAEWSGEERSVVNKYASTARLCRSTIFAMCHVGRA